MRFLRAVAVIFAVILATCALAQTAPLQFEVASVKVSGSGTNGVRGGCRGIDSAERREDGLSIPLGRCVITDGRLSHMIAIAWRLPQIGLIQNSPEWVMGGSERFTVEARAQDPATTTEAQLLTMLQNLLIERFQLKFHREDRLMPGFALTLGRDGPKLKESKSDVGELSFAGGRKPVLGGPVTLIARKQSIATLANLLSQIGEMGQISDQTGLSGLYDFQLSWDEKDGPVLATALQQQMGLRLNKSPGVPVSYFMFESARPPSGN